MFFFGRLIEHWALVYDKLLIYFFVLEIKKSKKKLIICEDQSLILYNIFFNKNRPKFFEIFALTNILMISLMIDTSSINMIFDYSRNFL